MFQAAITLPNGRPMLIRKQRLPWAQRRIHGRSAAAERHGADQPRQHSQQWNEPPEATMAPTLVGDLRCPGGAQGLVILCHGSGSSSASPRNRAVARHLRQAGLATWLLDLNTAPALPTVLRAIDSAQRDPHLAALPVALFGASSGAALALQAAAERPERVRAVVSRGGRPDLAQHCLAQVRCPVLLLVGEHDRQVLELNRQAAAQLRADHQLLLIPGAGHLFEEPGCLEAVADLSSRWLLQTICRTDPQSAA